MTDPAIKFAFNFTGAWASGTRYLKDDLVTYQGTCWKAVVANSAQTPAESAYWTTFAAGGQFASLGDLGLYATTTLLSAVTGMANGARAIVQDVGEYRYSSSSSATAVGVLVLAAAGGVGRWLLEMDGSAYRPTYNIAQFGATTAAANNSAAFQAAVTAATASGGTVFVPPGTWLLSSTVTLASGVRLVGAGVGASVIKAAANMSHNTALISATLANNLQIADLQFDGNGANQGVTDATDNGQNGVQLKGCAQVSVRDCYFHDFTKDGLYVGQDTGTSTQSAIVVISGNVFASPRRNGVPTCRTRCSS